MHRKKSDEVPSTFMKELLQQRDEHPDMLQEIVVMQQPSATVDEVTVGLSMEDLAGRLP